jgi:CHASE3 domain sensor protein
MRFTFLPLVLGLLLCASPGTAQEPLGYAGAGKLLTSKVVQEELRLSGEQIQRAGQVLRDVGGKHKDSFAELRKLSAGERLTKYSQLIDEMNAETFKGLKDILDAKQMERLRQLDRREQGPRAFRDPEVLKELNLTDEQRTKLAKISLASLKEIDEIVKANADKREEAAKKIATAQQKTLDEIVGLFADDQKKTLQKLIGEPLKVETSPRQVHEKPRDLNDQEEYARFLKELTEEGKYDPKKFAEFEAKLLKSYAEGRWKEIKWQENMATAMKNAKAEKKPIFLYIVVGNKGQKSAAEC